MSDTTVPALAKREEGCFCGCWRGSPCQCIWGDWGCPCGRDCPICCDDECDEAED